jgi:thiamine-monophosphate kinase
LIGEFDIIAKYFAPLAADFSGAFRLGDDAASLALPDAVITKDLLVEGVNFRAKDSRSLVAKKALRTNLSDLAAKGARPFGYLLGCVWPAGVKEEAIADFAAGLREDQDQFRLALLGGDTTAHGQKGAPFTVSITMIGAAGSSGMIRRSGAKAGDDVYVSGVIGDAGLGLAALSGELKPSAAHKAYLAARYHLPTPRVSLGGALGGHASAAIDVSDGLIADARHIAAQSGVAIEISADKIPVSDAASAWIAKQPTEEDAVSRIASFGDDYEILFSAPPERRRSIEMASQVTKTPVTRIGAVAKGAGVRLVSAAGVEIPVASGGYDHFKS